jgi:hypothetical protein
MRILPVSSVLLHLVTRYSVRRVRFEDMSSNATRILYQTDGMLLREAMMDSLLSRFGSFHYLVTIVRLILFCAVLQAACSAQLSLQHAKLAAAPPNITVMLLLPIRQTLQNIQAFFCLSPFLVTVPLTLAFLNLLKGKV